MTLDSALSRHLDPILETHPAEGPGVVVVVIDAGERSVFGEVVIRRIPHLRDRIVGITDAAIDLVLVVFPEPVVSLPAELAGWIIDTLLDRRIETRIEIVTDLLEQRQRNVADAVVCFEGAARSFAFDDNVDAVNANLNVEHLGVVLNQRADFIHEAVDDFVHAAHRLKQLLLPFVFKRLVEAEAPELGTEQVPELELWSRRTRLIDGYRATVARRAGILEAGNALFAAANTGVTTRIALVATVLATLIAQLVLAEVAEIL